MREGSLEAPVRHWINWQDPDFTDPVKLDAEIRRAFDICHGCRRCFNLCDSFPRLFDLVDGAPTGELDSVDSKDFKPVVDACTLCDLCFMTKCPYVPPHQFDLDFPHLMLRYRAAQAKRGEVGLAHRQLTETDRNGRLNCGALSGVVNWASARGNALTRPLMEAVAGVDRKADLPAFASRTFVDRAAAEPAEVNREAPAFGRKAVIYATCFANYNEPGIGMAARAVLAKNGVETKVVYPECCGMPQLETGDIGRVAAKARHIAAELGKWIDEGWDVIALVPSCALMLKFEWPLIVPDDAAVKKLAQATFDIPEYVMAIARKEGLAPGLKPLDGAVTVHIACHARAQNLGRKAEEVLKLIPEVEVAVIERCSGHGGAWGIMKGNFDTALKIGKPVAKQAAEKGDAYLVSECPLARSHIVQGIEAQGGDTSRLKSLKHPIQVLAEAYGL
ncbi:MAG: heterodisulfide reductase-related iron-sulfur binding cluster [Magnetospirillum sp. WYHS-4]